MGETETVGYDVQEFYRDRWVCVEHGWAILSQALTHVEGLRGRYPDTVYRVVAVKHEVVG